MITVQDAHEIIRLATIATTRTEALPLRDLPGRVLAGDIHAGFPMPRFTNAAMDGFAVITDDIASASAASPVTLPVTQKLPAGALTTLPLASGSCAQIMTGAPIPAHADTVVPFEETSGFGQPVVEFCKSPKRGANIRMAGEEVANGELLLAKGTRITPAEVAVLAAFGVASVSVFRRPKVALVTIGDELRLPGEEAPPLAIYNSNLPMLEACVDACGAQLSSSWQLPDNPAIIRSTIETALAESDVLLTAGGISTGEYDFVQETLAGLGVEKRFWKVAQKPGKPLYFGMAPSGTMVFSLPGNPVSALACFLEYCTPALNRLQGHEPPSKFEAFLETPFPADRKRHRFLFGRLRSESGRLLCSVSPKTESHMLTATDGANCIVESAPSADPLPAGSLVTCTPLPWSTGY